MEVSEMRMDAAQEQTLEAAPADGQEEAPAAQEEHAQSPQSAAGQEPQQDAAQAVRERIAAEIDSLCEDGWTLGQLQAFAQDEEAQRALAEGKTARQAATAYLMRRGGAIARGGRHGVPALRTAAGGVPRTHAIDRMSSSEFARFSDGLYERLLRGERIEL